MKQILFVLGFFLFSCLSVAAQGWQRTFGSADSISQLHRVVVAHDGGFLSAGFIRDTLTKRAHLYVVRTNSDGEVAIVRTFKNIILDDSGYSLSNIDLVATDSSQAFIVVGSLKNDESKSSGFALKLDNQVREVWLKKYTLDSKYVQIRKIAPLSNGQFLMVGNVKTNYYPNSDVFPYYLRINQLGDTLWTKKETKFSGIMQHILSANENGFEFIVDSLKSSTGTQSLFVQTDFNGNIKKSFPLGFANFFRTYHKMADGTIITCLGETFSKYDSNGRLITWQKKLFDNILGSNGFGYFLPTQDGNWFWAGGVTFANNSSWTLSMAKFDNNGTILWQKSIPSRKPNSSEMGPMHIAPTSYGGYILCGFEGVSYLNTTNAAMMRLDSNGNPYNYQFTGKIYNDVNLNCQYENEPKFKNWLVKAENVTNNDVYWGLSDSLGTYAINADSGRYSIKTLPPNANWLTCTPSVLRSLSPANKVDTVDFGVKPLINCPVLSVDMSAPFLRRCMDNTYTIRYCNDGTTAAENAYIAVTLDPLMIYQSTSRPLSSRVGNVLRFNIGSVGINECGSFTIVASVICGDAAQLGQTLCNSAHIYPDSVCLPATDWSGASIKVTGSCGRDSVRFTVRNQGTAPSGLLKSVVVEDQVLFLNGRVQLNPNGSKVYAFPSNGSTWRMTVEQEPNHPTSRAPTAVVEGCGRNVNGNFSMGFVTMFDNDDGNPAEDIDCQQIIGSYDPNDKIGYPIGYDEKQHFINQNQDIEYLIRFQNTGTDTAFTVVVRDTLPPELEISSLQLGASSHRYEANIYGKNILKFTFNDIRLVDSFRNEAASNGFVKFRIKQKKDLPLGTRIENSAAIYFDFNEPVLTKKTLHTIGKNWLTSVITDKPLSTDVKINVFPNPFSDAATFDLENAPLSIEGQFSLFDATGRFIRAQHFKGNRFDFERQDLPSGLFIFKIESKGHIVATGKLLID